MKPPIKDCYHHLFRKVPITKGVSEDKVISWLRDCKQSWISSSDIPECIDSLQSFAKGVGMVDTSKRNGCPHS